MNQIKFNELLDHMRLHYSEPTDGPYLRHMARTDSGAVQLAATMVLLENGLPLESPQEDAFFDFSFKLNKLRAEFKSSIALWGEELTLKTMAKTISEKKINPAILEILIAENNLSKRKPEWKNKQKTQ